MYRRLWFDGGGGDGEERRRQDVGNDEAGETSGESHDTSERERERERKWCAKLDILVVYLFIYKVEAFEKKKEKEM